MTDAVAIAPTALIKQARAWLGVPFRHQGRTRISCDCLGYIAGMLGELDSATALELLPINYGREPQSMLLEILTKHCTQTTLKPAVLLAIQWPHAEYPSHAAIYTGESMIHCYEAVGRVVEHGYRPPWIARTASIWALPDVTYP